MDFWTITLIAALLIGINGWWTTTLLINAVSFYSLWEEGIPFNWGFEMGVIVIIPFAWLFALVEIGLVYFK